MKTRIEARLVITLATVLSTATGPLMAQGVQSPDSSASAPAAAASAPEASASAPAATASAPEASASAPAASASASAAASAPEVSASAPAQAASSALKQVTPIPVVIVPPVTKPAQAGSGIEQMNQLLKDQFRVQADGRDKAQVGASAAATAILGLVTLRAPGKATRAAKAEMERAKNALAQVKGLQDEILAARAEIALRDAQLKFLSEYDQNAHSATQLYKSGVEAQLKVAQMELTQFKTDLQALRSLMGVADSHLDRGQVSPKVASVLQGANLNANSTFDVVARSEAATQVRFDVLQNEITALKAKQIPPSIANLTGGRAGVLTLKMAAEARIQGAEKSIAAIEAKYGKAVVELQRVAGFKHRAITGTFRVVGAIGTIALLANTVTGAYVVFGLDRSSGLYPLAEIIKDTDPSDAATIAAAMTGDLVESASTTVNSVVKAAKSRF